jgi:hypothetical protein
MKDYFIIVKSEELFIAFQLSHFFTETCEGVTFITRPSIRPTV